MMVLTSCSVSVLSLKLCHFCCHPGDIMSGKNVINRVMLLNAVHNVMYGCRLELAEKSSVIAVSLKFVEDP